MCSGSCHIAGHGNGSGVGVSAVHTNSIQNLEWILIQRIAVAIKLKNPMINYENLNRNTRNSQKRIINSQSNSEKLLHKKL